MWLLITLCFLRLCMCVFSFFSSFVCFFYFFRTQPAEVYQDKKVHIFFSVTSQARSVPFFPLPSTSSCISVFFLFSLYTYILCCDSKDHFFAYLLLFRRFCKAKGFFVCAEYACSAFDHKGSCWCWCFACMFCIEYVCFFFFALSSCWCLLCINVDGIIRCEM